MNAEKPSLDTTIAARVISVDWQATNTSLDEQGWAILPKLLTPEECHEIVELYEKN